MHAVSGFPAILATWKSEGWIKPELVEDTTLNQVTLTLKMIPITKSADSAEKSADSANTLRNLSKRHQQILTLMEPNKEYSSIEISSLINLKPPRTRQLLNELISKGLIEGRAATKNRRYIKLD